MDEGVTDDYSLLNENQVSTKDFTYYLAPRLSKKG